MKIDVLFDAVASLSGDRFAAVIKAQDCFEAKSRTPLFALEGYVVGEFFNFSDGEGLHYEGLTTIAICKNLEDAKVIFKKYL